MQNFLNIKGTMTKQVLSFNVEKTSTGSYYTRQFLKNALFLALTDISVGVLDRQPTKGSTRSR
jgi:hypothetical protein